MFGFLSFLKLDAMGTVIGFELVMFFNLFATIAQEVSFPLFLTSHLYYFQKVFSVLLVSVSV